MKINEKIMKRVLATLIIIILTLAFFTGCVKLDSTRNTDNWKEPHVYWKDIDVEVAGVEKSNVIRTKLYS